MIIIAIVISLVGFFLTLGAGFSYGSTQFKQLLMFLIPTITAIIVFFLAIMTINRLTKKQTTNNKKNKIPTNKILAASIIFGITVIIVFTLFWGNLLASSYKPPTEPLQIIIKSDGSIYPASTQIKQEGTLYTLQADININKLQIEKNGNNLNKPKYQFKA